MDQEECLFCNVWVECSVDTVKSTLYTVSISGASSFNFWLDDLPNAESGVHCQSVLYIKSYSFYEIGYSNV